MIIEYNRNHSAEVPLETMSKFKHQVLINENPETSGKSIIFRLF